MRVGAIAALVLFLASPVAAQFETASVVGTVHDATGATVADAKVTLINADTAVAAERQSNAEGHYEFADVKPGHYVVSAERKGFSIAVVDEVLVQVAARQRVDLTMAVGQLTEKVEVHAEAPLVETDTSQRGQVITGDQMTGLALNGREYSSLALLAPGVRQSALNKSTNGTPREGAFNVNGLRSVFNNFLIDGVDNNAYGTSNQGFSNQVMQPSPDAISEFRVVTNNESAEYGRAAGATVNVAYKSGTNQFHGDGWEFFRDTALNSAPYFLPADGKKPPLRRNQFGATLGGPLVQGKAFFFGDYEGFRQDKKTTTFSTIPTFAQDSGILPVDIVDPRTGVTYPAGTQIPMTSFARTVLGAMPAPNAAGNANNYVVAADSTNHSDKAGGKVDLVLTPALSMFGRYGYRNLNTNDDPGVPLPSGGGGNGNIYARNKQFVFGTTWVASKSSLLEFRFGWSNTQGGKNPPGLGSGDPVSTYGLSGLPSDPRIVGGLPSESISGYAALGRQATNPQWQYPTIYNPKVNYTWLWGRHSLKAGYEYQHVAVEVMDVNPLYGLDTYNGQFTKPAGAASNNLYNLADFMLGLRSQYAISTLFVADMRQDLHFTYAQDDIRVNDNLTINAGLRYEYATPMWEANNRLTNFDPATVSMVSATDGSIADRALVNPDRNNFAPRLGFALTPIEKSVIRGGWGLSYVHWNRIGSANLLAINGPQVVRAAVTQTNPASASFLPTEKGYPANITDPSQFKPLTALVSYIPQDYHSSPVQSWYVSAQHEFGHGMLVDLAYVGNKADDLLLIGNYNQAAPNDAAGSIPLGQRRPIPTFGDITYVFNGGKSRYNAFEAKVEWRMGSSLTLLSSLTLSKAKDNSAQSLENNNGNFPAPQDIHNLDADYGTSGYDQPYNTTTSLVWALPFGHGRHWGSAWSPVVNAVLGGWSLAAINTVTPGEPVTFTYTPTAAAQVSAITNDFSGANNYRPNIVAGCNLYADNPSPTQWFNKSCLTVPSVDQPFGNAPRNNVRGPNYWDVDMAANKRFSLGGQRAVEFRVEAFNLFNRANFTPPNSSLSSTGFGSIISTYDPRQVQLGAKLLW